MNRLLTILFAIMASTTLSAQTNKLSINVGGKLFAATLELNATAEAFAEMLPLSLNMSELNGNEKYCYLNESLPTDPQTPGTIHEGDIMLFGNSCIVIFYKTFTSGYQYTKIGHIDDTAMLAEALGNGSVRVDFSLNEPDKINQPTNKTSANNREFSAAGIADNNRLYGKSKRIIISKGKKEIK